MKSTTTTTVVTTNDKENNNNYTTLTHTYNNNNNKNYLKLVDYLHVHVQADKPFYTTLTNFSTKYLMMGKVYTDVGGIK